MAKCWSSHGELNFEADTGVVTSYEIYSTEADSQFLSGITRVDVKEWKERYPSEVLDECDILDVGYWEGEHYVEPCEAFRSGVEANVPNS